MFKLQIYVTQKAIKYQVIANHLVNKPGEDYDPITSFFPQESIMLIASEENEHPDWRFYFDDAVNVHENGNGTLLLSRKEDHYAVVIHLNFPCINNVAEHEA